MLRLRYRRLRPVAAAPPSFTGREDLKIRNLLDDPALRAAMGIPLDAEVPAPKQPWPAPLFDRRRLLQEAAA